MAASQGAGAHRARQHRAQKRAESATGPVQRRMPRTPSEHERLSRVFDAVEDLIHEVGLDRMTLTDVIRRSAISSSFLYDFFPNKSALVRAAGEDRLNKTTAILVQALREVNATDPVAIVNQVMPRLWAKMIESPKVTSFFVSMMADPDLRALDAEDTRRNAALLVQVYGRWFPRYTEDQKQALFEMMIITFGGMVRQSLLLPSERHPDLLLVLTDMLKSMIRAQHDPEPPAP